MKYRMYVDEVDNSDFGSTDNPFIIAKILIVVRNESMNL